MRKVTDVRAAWSVLAVLAAAVLAAAYLAGVDTRPAEAAEAAEAALYDAMPLDAAWTNSIARDINERGQVAGQGRDAAGQARAFLWEDGKDAVNLGLPVPPAAPNDFSRARGINEHGAVVGEWKVGKGTSKAFLYEDGQMKDLSGLASAQAINEAGQIAGSGTVNGETHAFLYENGAPTDLGATLGDPYSEAWGINDSGDVVGGTGSAAAQSEAFVYRDGAAEKLDNPKPFSASEAVGINNSGQVIGWSCNPCQNRPKGKAFLYDHRGDGGAEFESLEPLDRPEGPGLPPDDVYTRARDVDEAGRVVGWSRNDVADAPLSEQFSAVLWDNAGPGGKRQAQDLNELLIPQDSGWKLVDAYAINEAGQIVGSGYNEKGELTAFLLDPFFYDFRGFLAPVDNPPTVNAVNAGRVVPVKFGLSGDQGLGVIEETYPRSQEVPCSAADPVDGIEETVAAGASGISYDSTSDEYTYAWKTDKAWAGTCRQLTVKLEDGTYHRAAFEFPG